VDDVAAMRRALDLAASALTSDDVPVGALVLDASGVVVGEGFNTRGWWR
jgi:tRNA(adenine34) deaminase